MNLSTIPKETLERIQSHALARKLGPSPAGAKINSIPSLLTLTGFRTER